MEPFNLLLKARNEGEAAKSLLQDPDMREMAKEEITSREQLVSGLTQQITGLLVSADESASRDAILEIRAGTGGDEASLFAGDLARMYTMWMGRKGLRMETLHLSECEKGGFKEAIFSSQRKWSSTVFYVCSYESGGHRVQPCSLKPKLKDEYTPPLRQWQCCPRLRRPK